MSRFIRNTVVLAKTESTYGTDPVPTGGANAILVSEVTINPLNAANVPRDLVRGYLGGSEQLVGTKYIECSFSVEAAGSGTPTVAPAWAPLMLACGFAQTAQTASMDYTPTAPDAASTSVTIYYYLDGNLYKVTGARGTFSLGMGVGERPLFKFRFIGIDGGLTAATNATPTLTAFQTPLVVTDTNTADLVLGSLTYTAATGIVTGGSAFTSRGLQIDLAANIVFQPLVGGESIVLTQREPTGSISLDLTAAQAVTAMDAIKANTTTGVSLTHGTAAGNIIVVMAPKVQRINPRIEDVNGQAFHTYDLRLLPTTGNDELRIVAR